MHNGYQWAFWVSFGADFFPVPSLRPCLCYVPVRCHLGMSLLSLNNSKITSAEQSSKPAVSAQQQASKHAAARRNASASKHTSTSKQVPSGQRAIHSRACSINRIEAGFYCAGCASMSHVPDMLMVSRRHISLLVLSFFDRRRGYSGDMRIACVSCFVRGHADLDVSVLCSHVVPPKQKDNVAL